MTLNLSAIHVKRKQPLSTPALKKNKGAIKVQLFQRKLFVSPARLLGLFGNELLIRRGLLQYRITQDMKKNRRKDFQLLSGSVGVFLPVEIRHLCYFPGNIFLVQYLI